MATVGIHQEQGTKKIVRRYNVLNRKTKKQTTKVAGKSSRMTLAKLAYQNEFGANITIKPRYKTTYKVLGKSSVIGSPFTSGYRTSTEKLKYSTDKWKKKQGYLLVGKNGDFVAYFKPNQKIVIPERSFVRKTSKPDAKLLSAIQSVLKSTFITGGYRARQAMYKIAKLVTYRMKSNVKNNQVRNSPWTIKAKGFNSPLVDERDRIFKAIKYKIYKDVFHKDSKGYELLSKQTQKHVEKLFKSADQFVKDTKKAIRYVETTDKNRSF